MKEKPSYYAVLTPEVRYSNVLKPMEKLMYAEITCLSQSTGECWATNSYFAKLYGVTVGTVSKWIANLTEQGFVNRRIKYKEGTKQIEKRYITLTDPMVKKDHTPMDEKDHTPMVKKDQGNTTSFNNSLSIENFLPNETSLIAVKKKYGSVLQSNVIDAIQEFRDAATNKEGKPYKDLQSAFRNYVRKDYLASFKIKNKTHGAIRKQVNGKVLQMKNKPNLKKLARKQIEEQSHGR
tara:strand:- start:87 stop:794 length:708 start_codon:yes stop_codon:yes gene_type:complete